MGICQITRLKERLHFIVKNITVEPVIILYLIPIALTSFATDNLNLEKACRVNLLYNKTVCDSLTARNVGNFSEEENNVQLTVAYMLIWKNILRYSFPVLLIIFFGSWSDRNARRKPLLLLPILGELLTTIGLLLSIYFYLEWPMEVSGIVEGLFPAITGSNMLMTMAVFSYISDITTSETRTFRIGLVNMVVFLCVPIGTSLSGVLLKQLNFYGIFSLAAVLYILGLAYCWFCIKETREALPLDQNRNKITEFIDYHLVVDLFSVLIKRRENRRRLLIFLIMLAFILATGPSFGESTIAYLYMRNRFLWDELNASYFSTYSILMSFLGSLIVTTLLSKILRLDDTVIGLTAALSKLAASFCYAFSTDGWHFYLAQFIEFLYGGATIVIRSLASKVVPSNEVGRVFSLFGVCEAFAPFIFGPLYSFTYAKTLAKLPGTVFLIGVAFTTVLALIFILCNIILKRELVLQNGDPVNVQPSTDVDKVQYKNENYVSDEQINYNTRL